MYRIGQGIDFHKLVEGREFWLGGILIPHTKGALGHSDADVLLHAILFVNDFNAFDRISARRSYRCSVLTLNHCLITLHLTSFSTVVATQFRYGIAVCTHIFSGMHSHTSTPRS